MKRRLGILSLIAFLFLGMTNAKVKVHTIGDSTCANYDEGATVTRGWAQYLQLFLTGVDVNNRAKSGASSKSFYQESAYWKSVKGQMTAGDYVFIQFAHNDEKNSGMDGGEVKAYYTSIGDNAKASATDYRGTTPSNTYRAYLIKYIEETRALGCTPVLVGPICRMYFSGNQIRRNGQHDLGDSFSQLTADGIKEKQSVPADDHTMDYVWQMKKVGEEMNVPFLDLTTATRDLYLSYGDTKCHDLLSDGDGSTHLNTTGATLIARLCAQLMQKQGILAENVSLTGDISVSPANVNFGEAYAGQSLVKEITLAGFSLTPAEGNITVTATEGIEVSADKENWATTATLAYTDGTLVKSFYIRTTLKAGNNVSGSVTVSSAEGTKTIDIPVKATAISLEGGTDVKAYWRLEKDDSYTLEGPATVIPESWSEMYVQRYANPNVNTVWPDGTGFEPTRKTQRNLLVGDAWPDGEIDEVSTRYIQFGITAAEGTELKINNISMYVCGAGGNGMMCHVNYSTREDFGDSHCIFAPTKMAANNMLEVKATPVISLNGGQSLYVRVYPWYNGAAIGKTICISDVTISGVAMQSGDGIANVTTTTSGSDVTYNLHGQRVEKSHKGIVICNGKKYFHK